MIRLRTSRDGWRDIFVSDFATGRLMAVEPTQGRPHYQQGGVVVVQLAGLEADGSRPDSLWLLVDAAALPEAAPPVLALLGSPQARDLAHRALTGNAQQRDRTEAELSALAATADMMVAALGTHTQTTPRTGGGRGGMSKPAILVVSLTALFASAGGAAIGTGLFWQQAPMGDAGPTNHELSAATIRTITDHVNRSLREVLADPDVLATMRPQQPLQDGLSEAQFERLSSEVVVAVRVALEDVDLPKRLTEEVREALRSAGPPMLTDEQIEAIIAAIKRSDAQATEIPELPEEEQQAPPRTDQKSESDDDPN